MLIDKPGKIADGLYLMGQKSNLVYLVQGKQSMIIGGGMNWIAPHLEQQFIDMHVDPHDIKYLVIQHTHFDHVGAVPYLKTKFPWIKIFATGSAKKILSKEKAISYIKSGNNRVLGITVSPDRYNEWEMTVDKIEVDETINNNTVIELGNGIDVHFIETPGHSPCSVSVYIPKLKAIFPSDSAPCALGSIQKLISPSPQYDWSLYKQSLQDLLQYDIEVCCFEHEAAVTGEDARTVLVNGLNLCTEYEKYILGLYNESGDIEKVASQDAVDMTNSMDWNFYDEELGILASRIVVRNILKSAGIV